MPFSKYFIYAIAFALGLLQTTGASRQNYKTLPARLQFPENCTLLTGIPGTCRPIKHCLQAQLSYQSPKDCYYKGSEQFVCCPENHDKTGNRTADKACNILYPRYFPIILGIPTDYDEFPYMVALGWPLAPQVHEYDFKCGGVIVSRSFVLTAAHCGYINGVPPAVVLPGGVNLTDAEVSTIRVKRVVVHPGYDVNNKYHDIALVELQEKIFDYTPACLWTNFDLLDNDTWAVGYGHTKFGAIGSAQLLKANLSVIASDVCEHFYGIDDSLPRGIVKAQVCAVDRHTHRDTCQGDSGGPLIMYEKIVLNPKSLWRPYVVGITSFGQICGTITPGVYTRVSEYIDWIESNVWPSS